ncbi:DedA family protein [Aureimonas endophytica]|uniref:DedA family protein n=1 Tax=Aureimonas endophytica TaxID=2027858 RepID=A0A917E8I1_9HYPH|nr:DedA family protein [Aureimonas endophytica]GGE14571.1 DedA family protein [Aureimonas endophytica]
MLDRIMEWIADYGTVIVFATILIESSGLPVPGESMLVAAGVLAGQGRIGFWEILLAAWAGGALGDNVGYALGRRYGRGFVYRYAGRFGISKSQVARLEQRFLKRGPPIILFARFIFILRQLAGFLAGTARMPYGRFSFYNVLGAGLWPAAYCGGAYLLGAAVEQYLAMGRWVFAAVGLCFVVALGLTIHRFLREIRSEAGKEDGGLPPEPDASSQ